MMKIHVYTVVFTDSNNLNYGDFLNKKQLLNIKLDGFPKFKDKDLCITTDITYIGNKFASSISHQVIFCSFCN